VEEPQSSTTINNYGIVVDVHHSSVSFENTLKRRLSVDGEENANKRQQVG
jgi:hypothetical protein